MAQNIFEATSLVVIITLLLVPFPAHLAPTTEPSHDQIQGDRNTRQNDNNIPMEAADAFTGLAITLIYVGFILISIVIPWSILLQLMQSINFSFQIDSYPNFTTSSSNSAAANITNSMCNLLAYHDLLAVPTQLDVNTSFHNTSKGILSLLEANVQDACALVSRGIYTS